MCTAWDQPPRSVPEHSVEGKQDLENDERDDVPLDAQRVVGADEVDQRLLRARGELELAIERREALVDLELVLEQGIQPLELRVVPQQLRLVADLRAPDH